MPCLRFGNSFICCPDGPYDFEGYLFEVHSYFGPAHLRRTDGDIRIVQSQAFFAAVERWQKLPKEEREKYRVD